MLLFHAYAKTCRMICEIDFVYLTLNSSSYYDKLQQTHKAE